MILTNNTTAHVQFDLPAAYGGTTLTLSPGGGSTTIPDDGYFAMRTIILELGLTVIQDGGTGVTAITENFVATTDPTATDDAASGYAAGSRWINTATSTVFVCQSPSTGAAVWVATGAPAGTDTLNAVANPTVTDDVTAGYAVGSNWYNTLTGRTFLASVVTAGAAVWLPISVRTKSATADPTATTDAANGYAVGDVWINTTTDKLFTCVDATTGAAIWKQGGGAVQSSSFDIINILATTPVGTAITAPSVPLGVDAPTFNTSTVVVQLNGFEQVKSVDALWVSNTSFSLSTEVYSGDTVTIKP